MPTIDKSNHELLVKYLLGSLSAEETERLDELSVSDDAFASRLSEVENDLVDDYVRGTLSPETAKQFLVVYESSPERRQKLKFAKAFASFQRRTAATTVANRAEASPAEKSEKRWRFFWLPSLSPQWGFAAASAFALLLFASAYLTVTNRHLTNQLNQAEGERASLQQQAQRLQGELQKAQVAQTEAANSANNSRPSQLRVAAFMMLPSIRGAGELPSVTVSSDTDLIVLKLQLEATDFTKYRASLEDSGTRQVLWSSLDLKPLADGDQKTVSFGFDAKLLQRRNYIVQLSGIQGNGVQELISAYPFRAVVK